MQHTLTKEHWHLCGWSPSPTTSGKYHFFAITIFEIHNFDGPVVMSPPWTRHWLPMHWPLTTYGWVLEASGHEGIDGGLKSFVRERYNGEGEECVYERVWAEGILCVHSPHCKPLPSTTHSFLFPIPHVMHYSSSSCAISALPTSIKPLPCSWDEINVGDTGQVIILLSVQEEWDVTFEGAWDVRMWVSIPFVHLWPVRIWTLMKWCL
jgi:hypothetical protein